jgi:hypothetical protein
MYDCRQFLIVALLTLGMLWAAGSPAVAQIATGPDSAVDGYLQIGVDSYGGWASATFGGAGDSFNPAGPFTAMEVAFTSGMMLFVDGSERALLSTSTDWQDALAAPNLTATITSPNVLTDTNSDGVDDMAVSGFTATSATTNLSFRLEQKVETLTAGVSSYIDQTYTVTNAGAAPVDIQMVSAFDADVPWLGGFTNDQVGTSMWGAGQGTYVFQEEPGDPGITAVTLSSESATAYYGGKNTVVPVGGPPPFGFGTDVQVYDNFGVPTSWTNEIANVGAGINGVSGPNPNNAGSGAGDAFIGLQFLLAGLQPDETRAFTVRHTYGQNFVPEPSGLALILGGVACWLLRSRCRG